MVNVQEKYGIIAFMRSDGQEKKRLKTEPDNNTTL